MIHSQISQKMATLQSRVDAQLMRLNQQRKQLTGIRRRMERDYQMISARYSKLFNALNRNLRQRVTELDRPIMDLATTDADQVTNRSNQMVAAAALGRSSQLRPHSAWPHRTSSAAPPTPSSLSNGSSQRQTGSRP